MLRKVDNACGVVGGEPDLDDTVPLLARLVDHEADTLLEDDGPVGEEDAFAVASVTRCCDGVT